MVDLNDFQKETECVYKDERYSVRDNGAVMRHPREGGRVRPKDNIWTFGEPNDKGYCQIASVVIHRIVAVAFHGEPPTSQHVVDHIDTNRQNNRPENLRWLTKLENALNNPITRKRIIFRCGSIEAFIENPSLLTNPDGGYTDIEWMRAVTSQEAKNSWERLRQWAMKDSKVSKGGEMGEWIYSPLKNEFEEVEPIEESQNYILSLTPNAAQRIVFLFDKPNEFPCTPQKITDDPLTAYYQNLTEGADFFRNHNGAYRVVKSGFSKDRQSIFVMTKAGYKWSEQEGIPAPIPYFTEYGDDLPHSLTKVLFKDGLYIHDRPVAGFMPKGYIEELFAEYTQE